MNRFLHGSAQTRNGISGWRRKWGLKPYQRLYRRSILGIHLSCIGSYLHCNACPEKFQRTIFLVKLTRWPALMHPVKKPTGECRHLSTLFQTDANKQCARRYNINKFRVAEIKSLDSGEKIVGFGLKIEVNITKGTLSFCQSVRSRRNKRSLIVKCVRRQTRFDNMSQKENLKRQKIRSSDQRCDSLPGQISRQNPNEGWDWDCVNAQQKTVWYDQDYQKFVFKDLGDVHKLDRSFVLNACKDFMKT